MCDDQQTRMVLWGRHDAELMRAQKFDAECEKLEAGVKKSNAEAAKCGRRVEHLKQAAEIIGRLDGEIA